MLNVKNIEIVKYKVAKEATMNSITQKVFTPQVSPPMLTQSHDVLLSDCRWRCCMLLIMSSTDKEEAQCVFWSYSPREIIGFFLLKSNIFCSFF